MFCLALETVTSENQATEMITHWPVF